MRNTLGMDIRAGQSGSPVWHFSPFQNQPPRYSVYTVYGIMSGESDQQNVACDLGDNAVASLKSFFGFRAVGDINRVADPESDATDRPILAGYDRLFGTGTDTAFSVGEAFEYDGVGYKFGISSFSVYNHGLATSAGPHVRFYLSTDDVLDDADLLLTPDPYTASLGTTAVPAQGRLDYASSGLFAPANTPVGNYRIGWVIGSDSDSGNDRGFFPQTVAVRPRPILAAIPDVVVRYTRTSDPVPIQVSDLLDPPSAIGLNGYGHSGNGDLSSDNFQFQYTASGWVMTVNSANIWVDYLDGVTAFATLQAFNTAVHVARREFNVTFLPNEAQRRDVARIQESEQQLLGLITAILDFAKLESDRDTS